MVVEKGQSSKSSKQMRGQLLVKGSKFLYAAIKGGILFSLFFLIASCSVAPSSSPTEEAVHKEPANDQEALEMILANAGVDANDLVVNDDLDAFINAGKAGTIRYNLAG